jgi:hypothetical protein
MIEEDGGKEKKKPYKEYSLVYPEQSVFIPSSYLKPSQGT